MFDTMLCDWHFILLYFNARWIHHIYKHVYQNNVIKTVKPSNKKRFVLALFQCLVASTHLNQFLSNNVFKTSQTFKQETFYFVLFPYLMVLPHLNKYLYNNVFKTGQTLKTKQKYFALIQCPMISTHLKNIWQTIFLRSAKHILFSFDFHVWSFHHIRINVC